MRCPVCGQEHPQTCGSKLLAPAECAVCFEVVRPPLAMLPCGHPVCQEHFRLLGFRLPGSSSAAPGDGRGCTVLVEGQRSIRVAFPEDAPRTFGLLRELVAERVCDPDDLDAVGVNPSRVRLSIDGVTVNYAEAIPAGGAVGLRAAVQDEDWQDIVNSWKHTGDQWSQDLADFIERMAGLELPGTYDDEWSTDGHFPEIVRLLDRILARRRRSRGPTGAARAAKEELVRELLEVLREELATPRAQPELVLRALQRDYGL